MLAAAFASAPAAAAANTLTVTNTNDSGAGSLRQAIADAAPGDTIVFGLPAGSTINTPGGTVVIDKSLNITGPGAGALALSCQGVCRVLRVESGATVNISGLTIRDGFLNHSSDAVGRGGACVLNYGSLTLTDTVVTNGFIVSGASPEPGTASGGGIDNWGTLRLTNSTVSNNDARGGLLAGEDFGGDGNGGGINNRANATLILTNSTVTRNIAVGGDSRGRAGSASGGGIRNLGVLVMTDSTVSNNSAHGAGDSTSSAMSGLGAGGGVDNFGTMTADRCTFFENVATAAAALNPPAPAQGGGVNNRPSGTLTVTNSTVRRNTVLAGGFSTVDVPSVGSGGGINNLSTATVTNSTITDNVVRGGLGSGNSDGLGGPGQGGGVASSGALTMTNSTVSGNEAQGGVGRFGRPAGKGSGGGIFAEGTLTLTNCTVTLNTSVGGNGPHGSAEAGGVLFRGSGTARPLNTIVAGNSVRGADPGLADVTLAAPDVSGTFASQGHNLVGRNDGAETSFPAGAPNASGDLVGTSASPINAGLGPLAENGGPTRTHRPWPGSPAIEGGDNAVLSSPYNLSTDQRGAGFPRLFNAKVDIGSVEARDAAAAVALSAPAFVSEGAGGFDVTVTRTGGLDPGDVTVDFSATDGTASSRRDFNAAYGTLRFESGEASKTFRVFVTDDVFDEGDETVSLGISNVTGGGATLGTAASTLTIQDDDTGAPTSNPIDGAGFFARQHYVDFLGREPDPAGLDFWTGEIAGCGADAGCREVKRIHVSAAFFLSIEFRETGFFALRVRRVAFGNRSNSAAARVSLEEFLRDQRQLGEGVVVGAPDWERRLTENKTAYLTRIVESAAFRARYPETLTGAQYVDALIASAGITVGDTFRQSALNAYGTGPVPGIPLGGTRGRVAALRYLSEIFPTTDAETNPAFVLSEYFGYLRRNPTDPPDADDTGYQFWLAKLNQFGGDFVRAEMVKAFISSVEYRQRFGPQ